MYLPRATTTTTLLCHTKNATARHRSPCHRIIFAAATVAVAPARRLAQNGASALICAAYYGHDRSVAVLVNAGARIDVADSVSPTTKRHLRPPMRRRRRRAPCPVVRNLAVVCAPPPDRRRGCCRRVVVRWPGIWVVPRANPPCDRSRRRDADGGWVSSSRGPILKGTCLVVALLLLLLLLRCCARPPPAPATTPPPTGRNRAAKRRTKGTHELRRHSKGAHANVAVGPCSAGMSLVLSS